MNKGKVIQVMGPVVDVDFSESEIGDIRYLLNASVFKFYLANLSLEQLWALSHSKRGTIVEALLNSLDSVQTSEGDVLLASFCLENFLFQGNSFLEFYMLYLCKFLRSDFDGKISPKKFERALNHHPSVRHRSKKRKDI